MNYLPQNSVMGPLDFLEIYDFYDIPCSFSAKSVLGQFYFAILSRYHEDGFQWTYLPLSFDRLRRLHSAQFPLRDAFTQSETGHVYKVNYSIAADAFEATLAASAGLLPGELPEPGATVSGKVPILEMHRSATEVANALRADVVDILLGHQTVGYQAKASVIGVALQDLQRFYNAIRTRVRNSALSSALILDEAYHGSLGVRLTFDEYADLFQATSNRPLVNLFFDLLRAKDDLDQLKALLIPLKKRAIRSYRNFIQVLKENGADVDFTWASPESTSVVSVHYGPSDFRKVFDILASFNADSVEEITIKARLVGLNIRTRRFELWSADDDEKITGVTVDPPTDNISKATLSEIYLAKLVIIEKGHELTEESQRQNILQDLMPP